jgi:hypothetical protein
MAKKPTLTPEPEISEPSPVAPVRPAKPDPGVIDGEATEIRDEPAEPPPAPEIDDAPPRPGSIPPGALPLAAIAGGLGALIGAAIALIAAFLLDPRAAALDRSRASLATLEHSVETQSIALAALDQRLSVLEKGANGLAKADALEALAGRVGALEATNAGDAAKSALEEARAASAAAAKALDLAGRAPPPAAANEDNDADALAPRLDALEARLAKLEGASTAAKTDAPKTEARLAPGDSVAPTDAPAIAVLALSLDERFAAGEPFAAELAALAKRGVGADALAALKPFAASGAPTPAAIAASWASVEPRVAAAATPPATSGWDRLLDHMRALVRIRRVGAPAGADDNDSRLTAIGDALAQGNLASALDTFALLPNAARVAGADWVKATAARQSAAAASAALRADALARLTAGKAGSD